MRTNDELTPTIGPQRRDNKDNHGQLLHLLATMGEIRQNKTRQIGSVDPCWEQQLGFDYVHVYPSNIWHGYLAWYCSLSLSWYLVASLAWPTLAGLSTSIPQTTSLLGGMVPYELILLKRDSGTIVMKWLCHFASNFMFPRSPYWTLSTAEKGSSRADPTQHILVTR